MEQKQQPTLKDLLLASKALLQPPAPLPSSPPELLSRLRESSALLPWRDRAGWTEDDELDQIGDDDQDAAIRKQRRDELVRLVGSRSLDLVITMQAILVKEFWPVEQREGLDAKDFLLGTADLRLVRLLIAHVMSSLLLPLVTTYVAGLPRRAPVDPRLPAALTSIISLIESPQPPAATSSRAPLPPTAITQTITTSYMSPIIIATVAVAWTPTSPPATYAPLRAELTRALNLLPPTHAMASLGTALKMIQAGKKSPPKAWTRVWPAYVESAIGVLLSAQVQRPGGVRAVMENVFGEAANMTGPEGVEGPKLDHIANVLSRVPKNVTPDLYIPQLLTTLLDFVAPESASHPLIYIHTSAYVIHHLWSTSPIAVEWLRHRLHGLWLPQNPEMGIVASQSSVEASARTLAQLVTQAPPSPEFLDFLVGPILPPLFALHVALSSTVTTTSIEKRPETASGLAADVKLLLDGWGKVVPKQEGVKGIWSIIQGGKGWSTVDDGLELFWQKEGSGAQLVYGSPHQDVEQNITTRLDDEQTLMDQLAFSPDPATLSAMLKGFDRPDISSEIFLKVLDEWRVRVNAEDQDPMQSLLFLRLTLAMMDTMRDKLLTNPEHVLSFVEGVLSDEVSMMKERKQQGKGPLIQEIEQDKQDEELPELTVEGVEKMGMVETAISLLLASLESNEKLNHASAAILHPINDHLEALTNSPSGAIRNLARESLIVLLVRRSASLTSGEDKVSPAIATYRRAIKLVSDPILPVRAHGLVLLRDLVLSKDYDPALTPSIMDVYLQSILDKDSYIYLNAVKGLAAMADALGKEIFRTLVREYSDTKDFSGDRLDRALRIGEALGTIIQRAGKAFSANAGIVVPTLLRMFPDEKLPTILRTSALSLLSTAAESDHLALLPWAAELTSATIDLIQVESVTVPKPVAEPEEIKPSILTKPKIVLIDDEEPEDEAPQDTKPRIVDEEPTSQDSKHPALRRSAIVFLGLLVTSIIEASSEPDEGMGEFKMRLPGSEAPNKSSVPNFGLSPATIQRVMTVLSYVAHTDVDEVARSQAAEVVALVDRLRTVRLADEIQSKPLFRLS